MRGSLWHIMRTLCVAPLLIFSTWKFHSRRIIHELTCQYVFFNLISRFFSFLISRTQYRFVLSRVTEKCGSRSELMRLILTLHSLCTRRQLRLWPGAHYSILWKIVRSQKAALVDPQLQSRAFFCKNCKYAFCSIGKLLAKNKNQRELENTLKYVGYVWFLTVREVISFQSKFDSNATFF